MHRIVDVYPGGTIGARLARRFAAYTMEADLKRSFRRSVWLGRNAQVDPAPGRALVLYANHHIFHDSYLLWMLLARRLGRPTVVWMEAWERAPLFGPLGALPFPADDPKQRARTMRETARRMESDPRTALILYPEGVMRTPEEGVGPFRADLPRLARLLPDSVAWAPAAIRSTSWGESKPTALVRLGDVHDTPSGNERERLLETLNRLSTARAHDIERGDALLLLDGTVGADERWNLSLIAPLFRRWTLPRE